ncbi:MAG: 30S ribosomal protein S20 [Clostridia bacterium]|nr:30S ribosomal protein S20 [Clostridia bacterium]
MPNIKSAKKRVKTTEARTLRNKMIKSDMKTAIKKLDAAIVEGNKETIDTTFRAAVKTVDQATAKGVLKKNTASRKKAQMAIKVNKANA